MSSRQRTRSAGAPADVRGTKSVARSRTWRAIGWLVTLAAGACLGILVAGLLAGYRPMLVDVAATDSGGESPSASSASSSQPEKQHRVVIAAPTGAEAVAVGDELVVSARTGSMVSGRIIELEQGPDQGRSATVMVTAGESPGPRLVLLQTKAMKVRWMPPAWLSWLVTSSKPGSAVALALGLGALVMTVKLLSTIWVPGNRQGNIGPRWRLARPTGSARIRGVVLTVLGVSIATGGVASALFTGTDTVVGNQFSTGCFDAQVSQVQRGKAINSAEGTQVVAIAAVDPTRSVVHFSVQSDSTRPADSMIMAELASSTQLELIRRTDDLTPPTITVEWTVIEYGCGVSVQRGSAAGDGTAGFDIAITAGRRRSQFCCYIERHRPGRCGPRRRR